MFVLGIGWFLPYMAVKRFSLSSIGIGIHWVFICLHGYARVQPVFWTLCHRVTTKSIAGAACEVGGAVDCLLGEWGAWSTCDVSWVWQFSTWRQFPVLSPVILLRWVDSWMFETWRCFHGYVGGSNCTWVAVGINDQIWRNWPDCWWIFMGHC